MAANQRLVDLLQNVATEKKATPAQVALAWLLAQRSWFVPIPGTTKLARLKENLGAATLKFTADELAAITAAADKIKIVGNRYTPELAKRAGL